MKLGCGKFVLVCILVFRFGYNVVDFWFVSVWAVCNCF